MPDIGLTNNLHGYNPVYREDAPHVALRFQSFTFQRGRPGSFINRRVGGTYTPSASFPGPVYDHQGHIVPQNLLNTVLYPIAVEVSDHFDGSDPAHELTFANVTAYLAVRYPNVGFAAVTEYIENRLIAAGGAREASFVTDENGGSVEERVGGYFSVMMWNPSNLCRAPSDAVRGGYPGEQVDDEVRRYLIANSVACGVSVNMRTAFTDVGAAPDEAQVRAFILACSQELIDNIDQPKGYYAFDWKLGIQQDVLVPG